MISSEAKRRTYRCLNACNEAAAREAGVYTHKEDAKRMGAV